MSGISWLPQYRLAGLEHISARTEKSPEKEKARKIKKNIQQMNFRPKMRNGS